MAFRPAAIAAAESTANRLHRIRTHERRLGLSDKTLAGFLFREGGANQEIDHGLIPEPAFIEIVLATLDHYQLC